MEQTKVLSKAKRALKVWQNRLGLEHWRFSLKIATPSQDKREVHGNMSIDLSKISIDPWPEYQYAEIVISPNYDAKYRSIEDSIRHELLHAVVSPLIVPLEEEWSNSEHNEKYLASLHRREHELIRSLKYILDQPIPTKR